LCCKIMSYSMGSKIFIPILPEILLHTH
jgi:hypothetical protein